MHNFSKPFTWGFLGNQLLIHSFIWSVSQPSTKHSLTKSIFDNVDYVLFSFLPTISQTCLALLWNDNYNSNNNNIYCNCRTTTYTDIMLLQFGELCHRKIHKKYKKPLLPQWNTPILQCLRIQIHILCTH